MNTQAQETRNRDSHPENYRNPGSSRTVADMGPSTREMLGLLNALEATTVR